MTSDKKYDSIRPFNDDEVDAAVDRLCHSSEFLQTFQALGNVDTSLLVGMLKQVHTRDEFQEKFFGPVIQAIIKKSANGVSCNGLQYLDKNSTNIYISNHRDIILDSAILNVLLRTNGYKYAKAAIGNNLFVNDWVSDVVLLNSCFIIERDISVREMLQSSSLRSSYIRETITEGENSVWIAQREGRTKNGDDRTQPALLKMLRMSGSPDLFTNLKELNITPVSISYEIEPCDYLKTQELYTKTISDFTKTPDQDMTSMREGLANKKGRIHFEISTISDDELREVCNKPNNGERISSLAELIDSKIHKGFHLWENNYIAYDLLHSSNKFADKYTQEQKDLFIVDMKQKVEKIEGNTAVSSKIFLDIYASPVKNKFSLNS